MIWFWQAGHRFVQVAGIGLEQDGFRWSPRNSLILTALLVDPFSEAAGRCPAPRHAKACIRTTGAAPPDPPKLGFIHKRGLGPTAPVGCRGKAPGLPGRSIRKPVGITCSLSVRPRTSFCISVVSRRAFDRRPANRARQTVAGCHCRMLHPLEQHQ